MLELTCTRTKKKLCSRDGLSYDSKFLFVVAFSYGYLLNARI